MPHPIIEALVEMRASGETCDYENCPGRTGRAARKRLIYHRTYLFVHQGCVALARQAARSRGETFGFRSGL